MPIIFHQDADPEDIVTAVIDDPRWRWIGPVVVGSPTGGMNMCRSLRPVRGNGYHLDIMVPAIKIDEITDTTIDDIIIEWSGYSGRN